MKINYNFSTLAWETSENMYLVVAVSWLVSSGVCIYILYFFYVYMFTNVNQKKIRGMELQFHGSRKEYVMWTCLKFSPM